MRKPGWRCCASGSGRWPRSSWQPAAGSGRRAAGSENTELERRVRLQRKPPLHFACVCVGRVSRSEPAVTSRANTKHVRQLLAPRRRSSDRAARRSRSPALSAPAPSPSRRIVQTTGAVAGPRERVERVDVGARGSGVLGKLHGLPGFMPRSANNRACGCGASCFHPSRSSVSAWRYIRGVPSASPVARIRSPTVAASSGVGARSSSARETSRARA